MDYIEMHRKFFKQNNQKKIQPITKWLKECAQTWNSDSARGWAIWNVLDKKNLGEHCGQEKTRAAFQTSFSHPYLWLVASCISKFRIGNEIMTFKLCFCEVLNNTSIILQLTGIEFCPEQEQNQKPNY